MPLWLQPMDLAVALICCVALVTDLSRQRVPNQLTMGGMGLGVIYWSIQQDPLFALGGMGVAFLTMFPGFGANAWNFMPYLPQPEGTV